MSLNRENVIWQSPNGTWNRAFYSFYEVNTDDEDFDNEWDVEYESHFNWASTGHPTEEAAEASWRGCNPGGHQLVVYTPQTAAECAALDAKVVEFRAGKHR